MLECNDKIDLNIFEIPCMKFDYLINQFTLIIKPVDKKTISFVLKDAGELEIDNVLFLKKDLKNKMNLKFKNKVTTFKYSNNLDKYINKKVGYFIINLCDDLLNVLIKYYDYLEE